MPAVKLIEVDDGFQLFAASTIDARFLYNEIFRGGTYAGIALPEKPLVIDVGANIGLFLLFVKNHYPDAEVLAFEPLPDLVEALRRNVGLHELDDVVVYELALGSAPKKDVPFTYYPVLPSSSTMFPQDQERLKAVLSRTFPLKVVDRMYQGREIAVNVDRLSNFLHADRTVDLLKIDAVGAELEIMRGIDAGHWSLVRNVFLDVQDVHGRVADVCDFLASNGLQPSVRTAPLAAGDGLNYLVHGVRP